MHSSFLLCGATRLTSITSKRGNKNFYKGRGAPARAMGRITNKGHFHMVGAKADRFLFTAPDLTGFTLKSYIASNTPYMKKLKAEVIEATVA